MSNEAGRLYLVLLPLFLIVVSGQEVTLRQNMTVSDRQPIGSFIGQVGSPPPPGSSPGWSLDAQLPFDIYFVPKADNSAGIGVNVSGVVSVTGTINMLQKSTYQFLAVSAKNVNILVSDVSLFRYELAFLV
jgi:hypothetical protein